MARNRDILLEVLQPLLSEGVRVLEIGSGSGEHAVHFAQALPALTWIPSDPDDKARASVAAWAAASGVTNVQAPLDLNVEDEDWSRCVSDVDVVVSMNMIHISPPSTVVGLMTGASELLRSGGSVVLYGPFKREGKHTAPSNEDFDRWLKDRDPRFGVRDIEEVEKTAHERGLALDAVIEMPANNLVVVFKSQR